jgi:deoxyadenosine/deoxycytidine kinase
LGFVDQGLPKFVKDHYSKQPIFVEFVGAAGAGKSFIASKLCDELDRRRVRAMNLVDARIRKLDFRNYLIILHASLVALRIFPRSIVLHKKAIKRLAKLTIRRKTIASNTKVIVCDEGIFQIIRALFRNSRAASMIDVADRLKGFVEMPDIVVVVDASVDTVFARRTTRDRPGDMYDRNSVARDVSMVRETVAVAKHVQSFSEVDMNVLVVDVNPSDLHSVVEEVATLVESRAAKRLGLS